MAISYIPLYDEVNPGQIFSPGKTIFNFAVRRLQHGSGPVDSGELQLRS